MLCLWVVDCALNSSEGDELHHVSEPSRARVNTSVGKESHHVDEERLLDIWGRRDRPGN
jgi:hypothetical protein